MPTSLQICIVGAGPRGTSVLSRINANRFEVCPHDAEIVVHMVDPFPPGPGRVWRTDQSERLLMNTVAAQVTLFTDESVACAGPVVPGPSLYEWATTLTPGSHPEHVLLEAARLGPNTYPSRALYGHYLEWVFEHLTRTAPPGVSVRTHRTTAVALEERANGRQVVFLEDGGQLEVDAVVLTLGHSAVHLTSTEVELREFARAEGLTYVPPCNPADVDVDLDQVRPGEHVALRGMGLTFFDYLALFTEGRGGRFKRNDTGLTYVPSGREPVLHAGSRRGIPYHARGENQKGVDGRHEPLFLTQQVISGWRARPGRTFMRDIWPLIDKEVRSVYYHALLTERGDTSAAAAFVRDYVDGAHDEPELLRRYRIAPVQWWDWDRLVRPFGDRRFTSREQFHRWLVGYLHYDAAEARRGNVDSPLKAALDVLRDLRNEIRLVVDHGGITGSSYRDELDRWYTPLNAFLSIGPPLRRIEEMAALIEAGVLHAIGPDMRVRPDGAVFLVDSPLVDAPPVAVTTLVEARIPGVDLRRTANPLLRNLLATGQATTYRIPDEDDGHFESGGLAVTQRPYRILDAAQRPHPRRFAFGVPTEYVHWVTAVGVRPGVGSVSLEDADAIARTVLQPVAVDELAVRRRAS